MENAGDVLQSMYWSYQEELSESYNWFGTMMSSGVPTNKVIEYCLEDPDYLNRVINLSMNVFSRAFPMNLLVREKSITAHRLISNYFNEKDTLLNYHVDEYDHIIGLYQEKNHSFRIENKEGKLYMTVHRDGTTNQPREIFPISKTCYTASNNSGYFYLRFNANNNVEKIVESFGLKKFEFIKIE